MSRRPDALRVTTLGPTTISLDDLPPCKGGKLSRRDFCVGAGAGLLSLGLAACLPDDPHVVVGDDITGGPPTTSQGPPVGDAGTADLASQGAHDSGTGGDLASAHDMAHSGGSCAGTVNGGSAAAIASGTATLLSGSGVTLFLCRDAGGLYAMDAGCTHEGRTLQFKTTYFYCPKHGAHFDLNGQHPTLPAFTALDHYPVCVDGSGNVVIDVTSTVAATTRT